MSKLDRLSMESFRRARTLWALALLLALPAGAQPVIEHDDVSCLSRDEFTQFLVDIAPPEEVRAAKIYFRSELYRDFYFVEMVRGTEANRFQAVIPIPSEETRRVVYYIEALDLAFQTGRSPDIVVPVEGDSRCRPGPGGILFPGDPGIVVGAVNASAPALPAGFQATGITGFLTAAGGAAAAGGGGIGAGVAIAAAAGAAAGVGVVVASGESENPPPVGAVTTSPGATTSTAATTTTAPPASTTSTSPSGPGSSTTTISGGSTTTPPAPESTTTSTSTSTTTSTSTSTSTSTTASTTTTAPPTLTACMSWVALGNCEVLFDSCSTPAAQITAYEWRMLGPPVPPPPATKSFTFSFAADPRCGAEAVFNHPVRLTVFDQFGQSASVQENVAVKSGAALREGLARVDFESRLVALPPDGRVRGQLAANGALLPPETSASPARHSVSVSGRYLRIEGVLATAAPEGTFWELDFGSSAAVVPGSLQVEMGTAAGRGERQIVLRLAGVEGERFRIRLEIR
jgi:hypothetical protein